LLGFVFPELLVLFLENQLILRGYIKKYIRTAFLYEVAMGDFLTVLPNPKLI
jgi:hypothetical protein